jgi:hypothetical protein
MLALLLGIAVAGHYGSPLLLPRLDLSAIRTRLRPAAASLCDYPAEMAGASNCRSHRDRYRS